MQTNASFINDVRGFRERRAWTQEDLAQRTGLSRPEISAIETGRLVPSAAAALAIARAFGCAVESIFQLPQDAAHDQPQWVWQPTQAPTRFWVAQVQGNLRLYPVEFGEMGQIPHDGVWDGKELRMQPEASATASRTLVLATCDPAVGILAAELARTENIRLIALRRSSQEALQLLHAGLVHGAGAHLVGGTENRLGSVAKSSVVSIADWEEGVVSRSPLPTGGLARALREVQRWVWREPGSGARQCQDLVLHGKVEAPRHTVDSHVAVVEAVRSSWADAGIALRLSSAQAGLAFLSVRTEPYDIHLAPDFTDDFRFTAFLRVVRSKRFRSLLADLPGYSTPHTGEVRKQKHVA